MRKTQHIFLFKKQVRTNIGLADTLIPSSFIYLIYMGGTGPCDSIKIIFGYPICMYADLTYMGGTGPCGPMTIIFGSVIKS